MKTQRETIDCTPSWNACAQIFIRVIENSPDFNAKNEAKKAILHMAKVLDVINDENLLKPEAAGRLPLMTGYL